MSVNKLKLYNDALGILGERKLASLTENREPRRVLDDVWDFGVVRYCLERGQWTFATRSMKYTYSPSVEPPWGYRRSFNKPDDYVRTVALCSDEYFLCPLLRYSDEANTWFADEDDIYVKYTSDDPSYGNDMGKWPETFAEMVSARLAHKAAWRITQSGQKRAEAKDNWKRCMLDAKSNDAMNQPTVFPPQGTWTRARRGGRGRGDGGSRGNLIG